MKNSTDYFYNRKAALGTKHNKEIVIAPIFKKEFNLQVLVPEEFDTDRFGTFTREIPRIDDQLTTARSKAEYAMKVLNLDIGIASEGSFGASRDLTYVNTNVELVIYVDKKYNFEVYGSSRIVTPFAKSVIAKSLDDVMVFAAEVDFPNHGIVVRSSENDYGDEFKGIINQAKLEKASEELLKKNKYIWLETDLRAHVNQSRMKNIKKATLNLIENLKRYCPKCGLPGFIRTDSKLGLPCETCNLPTMLPLMDVYSCSKCDFKNELMYPNNKKTAYCGYCDNCNP